MRRFVHKVLLFSALSACCYLLWILFLGGTGFLRTVNYRLGNYGHLFSRYQEAAKVSDIDVLFLGSSHCYRTFDTRYFDSLGYRSFNLGSSNQTPVQTLVLLRQLLPQMSPKLVVFEVHPDIMSNDGVEGAVDLLSNVPVESPSTEMALQYGSLKVFNTWLYALLRHSLTHDISRFQEDSVLGGFAYVPGGFVYPVEEQHFLDSLLPQKTIMVQDKQVEALSECLQMLRDRTVPYLLVEVPSSKALNYSYTNHSDFERLMQSLGPYQKLSSLPCPDSVGFYDADHLTQYGVRLVCRQMADILSSQNILIP